MIQFDSFLVGRPARVVAGLLLLGYLFSAFEPFELSPPQRLLNGASVGEGTASFARPGVLRSTGAAGWIETAARLDAFTLRLRFRAAARHQSGPAGIFTVSANNRLRNVTVEQSGADLLVRLRTSTGTVNGHPGLTVPRLFADPGWHDLVLRVQPGFVELLVDGRAEQNRVLARPALTGWDRNFRVALGNELTGQRPWLGEIAVATVEVGGTEIDYLAPGRLAAPQRYWAGIDFNPLHTLRYMSRRGDLQRDALLNLLAFVPLGFALSRTRRGQVSIGLAVGITAAASLSVEVAQEFFRYRNPSVLDLLLNVLGAAAGAIIAQRLTDRFRSGSWMRRG